ncbi:Wzy polymerase domain-containing protein [Uliginosibacterium sp. 31-16]|uniref:PglL family O-oligosaccharyltransferase n=1 Tax=Uliginosibacterium sp. 31-16 TaxID=3068315 RepID=UPI00273E7B01|nr:O-antigen ligase family protein [Uliginosibacterium sp. 31-16]MDP5240605.1 Wzy polymerase domain-containing protein [Uliginosibacterium sp. 31-16]
MPFRLLSAFALFLGLALATLINLHPNPQTVVYAEWSIALAAVLGFGVWVISRPEGLEFRVGGAPWLVLLVILVCLAWQALAPGLGYAVYLGLFLLCYAQGAALRGEEALEWFAAGMLVCALLQSLAGLAQLAGWSVGGLVMGKIYLQAFGNIGQANHYADLVFLGLASLCFLHARSCLNAGVLIVLTAWLALAGAASASRGSLLYTAAFLVLGVWSLWRGDVLARRSGRALLLVVACSVVAQALVTYGHILDTFGVTTALDRAGDAGSNGQRLFNWTAAWQTIQAHPWIGQGPATFYKASIDAMFTTAPANFPKFAEHAHNLPLNMAAELGVPLTVLVIGCLLLWYLRHLLAVPTAARIWALACVAVVGLHSMVEYPLWYAYLLVPTGLAIGVADAENLRLPVLRVPRCFGVGVAVVAMLGLTWVAHDWWAVRSAYVALAAEEPDTRLATREKARRELARVSPYSVFALHAESLRLQSWHPDEGAAAQMADRCDAHWQYKPGWYLMMRCGEAYALAGREAALKRLSVALCDGFPAYRTSLNDWASAYDAKAQSGLRLGGHACLR